MQRQGCSCVTHGSSAAVLSRQPPESQTEPQLHPLSLGRAHMAPTSLAPVPAPTPGCLLFPCRSHDGSIPSPDSSLSLVSDGSTFYAQPGPSPCHHLHRHHRVHADVRPQGSLSSLPASPCPAAAPSPAQNQGRPLVPGQAPPPRKHPSVTPRLTRHRRWSHWPASILCAPSSPPPHLFLCDSLLQDMASLRSPAHARNLPTQHLGTS